MKFSYLIQEFSDYPMPTLIQGGMHAVTNIVMLK